MGKKMILQLKKMVCILTSKTLRNNGSNYNKKITQRLILRQFLPERLKEAKIVNNRESQGLL